MLSFVVCIFAEINKTTTMNNQLIEKIITSNNLPCPKLVYENPLIDKHVSNALSKSFLKILNLPQEGSNVSNNLRLSILENIRKMCRIEPQNHAKVNEDLTKLLTEVYEESVEKKLSSTDSIFKSLDAFLIRRMKEMDITTSYESSVNPEIIHSLINLNQSGVYLEKLSQDIIHWSNSSSKQINVLKDLWHSSLNTPPICDDISIKLKNEIENLLLESIHTILINRNLNVTDTIASNIALNNLMKQCSNSPECFRICSGILNFLFIMTNFDTKVQEFIEILVKHVKENCSHITFSVLYPVHVSHIVVLMDFNLDILPPDLRADYVKSTMKYLSSLYMTSESDLILLLSHFPQWFDVFCNKS